MPDRIQRSRSAGWRMPAGAIYVGRPTPWGNPFPFGGEWIVWAAVARGYRADRPGRQAACIAIYREWLTGELPICPITYESGIAISVRDACRGIAQLAANAISGGRVVVPRPPSLARIRSELGGHDLACWCRPADLCHADVLLELANSEPADE